MDACAWMMWHNRKLRAVLNAGLVIQILVGMLGTLFGDYYLFVTFVGGAVQKNKSEILIQTMS